jgi:hypothetical protein
MGLGGVDKILVVQLSVCQFWQETGRTGMLAESVLCAPKLQLRANQKISQQPEKVWFLLYVLRRKSLEKAPKLDLIWEIHVRPAPLAPCPRSSSAARSGRPPRAQAAPPGETVVPHCVLRPAFLSAGGQL